MTISAGNNVPPLSAIRELKSTADMDAVSARKPFYTLEISSTETDFRKRKTEQPTNGQRDAKRL